MSEPEIKTAIFEMASNKAPGPDGLPEGFYQKNWTVVGQDI